MNWQSSTQWLQGINCKRWAARQSPSWTSTANQIRLLLELVTVQPSHAATRTRLKGKVNFKNIFLLPAKSLNSGSTKASRGPLMLSRFRDWFQMGSVPLWLKTYFQTNVVSDKEIPRWFLLIISTGLWRTEVTFIPRQAAGMGRREAIFYCHEEQFVKWLEAAPETT